MRKYIFIILLFLCTNSYAVTDNNPLVVNQDTDRVGIGTATPTTKLEVDGIITGDGTYVNLFTSSSSQVFPTGSTTVVGTTASGDYTDTFTINQTYHQIDEIQAANPAIDIIYRFNGNVTGNPAVLNFEGRYQGSAPHTVEIQGYDFNLGTYVDILATEKDLPHSTTDYTVTFNYPSNNEDYVSSSSSSIRIYHPGNGIGTHDLYTDLLSITPETLSMPMSGTNYQLTGVLSVNTSNDITSDGDSITITRDGTYLLLGTISFSGTANATIFGKTYINGSPAGTSFKRKMGSGGDVGSAAGSAILDLSASDVITFYFSSDTLDSFISVDVISFNLTRIN